MGYVPATKKEIKHTKQSLFDKVREEELIEKGLFVPDSKRPFTAAGVTSLKEAEFWRHDVIKELVEWVEKISDPNLDDFRCREWNDLINKLMREKYHWEQKIKELGGPDYLKKTNLLTNLGGETVPGTRGYLYFGQAKYLPGVRELFEQAVVMQEKIKPEDLNLRVDCDYFGFRDEDDGLLLQYEKERDENEQKTYGIDGTPYLPSEPVPSQQEVEAWFVEKRKQDLQKRFLSLKSLDGSSIDSF